MSTRPTWDELTRRYPELTYLAQLAKQAGEADPDTYGRWYGQIKPTLVGMFPDQREDYDVASQHLLRLYTDGDA